MSFILKFEEPLMESLLSAFGGGGGACALWGEAQALRLVPEIGWSWQEEACGAVP